jgi:hypothetical protein
MGSTTSEHPPSASQSVARSGRSRRAWPMHATLIALLAAPPPSALAGESNSSGTAPRVRVTLVWGGKRIVGQLVEQNEAALVLERSRKNPERISIPRADVAHLELSVRRSRKAHGLGVGFLVGAGLAVAVGVAGGSSCDDDATGFDNLGNIMCSRTDKTLAVGLFTVPLCMAIGAAWAPGEQWRPERLPPVAIGVGPAPGGGVAAQVALRF